MDKTPSVWSYVCKMPPEQLKGVYGDFPLKVRHLLGEWLEEQPWDYITGTDSFCTETAKSVLSKLIEQLEMVGSNCRSDTRLIMSCVEKFKNVSQQEPMQLILLFRDICKGEMEIVLKQNPQLALSFQLKEKEVMYKYQRLKLQYNLKQTTEIQQRLKIALENLFHGQVQEVTALQQRWVMSIDETLELLSTVQNQTLRLINIWKRWQQMAGNGATFDESLLTYQDRLEFIFGIHEELIRMIKELGESGKRLLPPEYLEKIFADFTALIKSSFLVDKQPPQVLKTQTKFQASVNFMLGSKILTGAGKMPIIKAHIITEKKAQELFGASSTEALSDGVGEIENGRSVFEFSQANRACGAVFKNMLLKKIKRCERKGSESVTEEKCAILFTTEITLHGSTHIIQTLSLPIVVIVHGNQDNNAKATILWDNAFAEIGRHPFYVEEKVPWKKMCKTLNMKFMSEVGTKQELTPVHFRFLAQKIFGDNSSYDDVKERMVSWSQFNKETLRERNFTFWHWFDGVMDLTRKHLKEYWSDGLILGFVSKQYVHTILGRAPNGTFLLRFSDSEIGGITIAHIVRGEDGSGQIQNIQPFTAKDLQILSLGDRVRDLKQLTYLYEKGEKDIVFEKYYKKVSATENGYKRAVITLIVQGDENEAMQSPSRLNDNVPMDEGEMYQNSASGNILYQSPIYSPGSPVTHLGNSQLIHNIATQSPILLGTQPEQIAFPTNPSLTTLSPSLSVLSTRQEQSAIPVDPRYPSPPFTIPFMGSDPIWNQHYAAPFAQPQPYPSGENPIQLDEVLEILCPNHSNLPSFTQQPMEEDVSWN
ncbi:signal transducer and activator of transcription 6 [Hyperolius riggenbachi]|uniref:signal transducer and activator of transcription 6 n=1 Tax=Hyperolius riggenbachi TaxID=752182 RepID=UPI0035A3975B